MYDYHDLDDRRMKGTLRDWRKALRAPTTYRVGNAVRLQPQFVLLIVIIGVCLLIVFYYHWVTNQSNDSHKWINVARTYNATYPLTQPERQGELITFRIGIVTDLDTKSKSEVKPNTWISYLKKGFISYNPSKEYAVVTWDKGPPTLLSSTYSEKGRGMELSELIVYDGRLLTFDDRSGMVYEIVNSKMVPWVVLANGNGHVDKGFKAEWATVKDDILYVGSMGKEWTTPAGDFENWDPMWVKAINLHGEVQHLNWVNQFKSLRSSIGIHWPGYMIHESGVWSPIKEKWHFLPRRCSHEVYNESKDEMRGCNYLITADNHFNSCNAIEITKLEPKLGFSSFKFIPGTNDEAIVALKTTEFEGKTATYISAFKIDGTKLMADTFIENLKYEGLEFI